LGCGDQVLQLCGVREFLDYVDRGREFWRDGGGIIADILDWVAGPGFSQFIGRFKEALGGVAFADALEFRQRYLIQAMRGKISL